MAMHSTYFGIPLNMHRVCRVCLTESTNMSPIFCSDQEVDHFSGLPQKIQICGSIQVQEQDGLPSLICNDCIFKASVAHDFRQLCQNSDARLRLYFNKPARSNLMETSTQTEPEIRIVLNKNTNEQNRYCVKDEEQQVLSDIHQSTGTFVQEESSIVEDPIEDPIDIHDQKLFECNLRFEVPKETERMTEDLANVIQEKASNANEMNTHEINTNVDNSNIMNDNVINSNTIHSNLVEDNTLPIPCAEEISVANVGLNEVDKLDNEDKTEINNRAEDYIGQELLNENLDHQEAPLKRTSNRKVKSVHTKTTFSDDEVEDDYYNRSSDSQDSEEPNFKCKVCSKLYTTQKGLKKHILVHDEKHNCNVCLKSFCKLENLEKHKLIHVAKPHACRSCHTSFSKPQSLAKHLKSHTEKANNITKEVSSDDPKEVQEPKKEMKSEEDTEDETPTSNEPDEFGNAPELFKCDICDQYCSTMKNLKRHALIHGEKKYSCFVCKKWFFRPDTLKKHAEKHGHGLLDNLMENNKLFDSDDEAFPNPTGNIFGDNDNSKKDDNEEDGTGEYKCQHCEKVMTTKKGLRRHVSMHKPKAEPATCEICKKVCASQARLVIHQKTHNKPKEKVPREYLCHICSKVYPSNSSLTYHMRTHTGVKPHVCKTCNSGFTTTTSLANHIRIHTGDKPFVCHVCSAAFAVSSAFRRHLTRHTGEANYLCKTCGKAFKRLSTLKEHTYTHSGEKPYVCKTCGAAYSHSGSLFAHQKRCRIQYGDPMLIDDDHHHHHHSVAHHIHVNNVQSAVRSLAVIGQMF